QFAQFVLNPELARLLPGLYPGGFPHLAAYTQPRAALAAMRPTGIPAGVVPGFQNFTGTRQADLLRLNLAVPPSANPNPLGLVAGDSAGFPNGRRLLDDVVNVELRAVAGLTIPLVDPSFTPDGAASLIQDGTALPPTSNNFPAYLATCQNFCLHGGGCQTMPGTTSPCPPPPCTCTTRI